MSIRWISRLAFIFNNARWRSLPQSITSCILAVSMAIHSENFSAINALIAAIGVLSAHLSANLFDDFFDYIQGNVTIRNKVKGSRGLKCAAILNHQASIADFLIWACTFGSIAVLTGIYFVIQSGLPVLYFMLTGAFLCIFYSAPPFRLSYRGFGELIIGLMFGPLLICGVYYVSAGNVNLEVLLLSIAAGLLVTNIVYVHSIMDIKADISCRKKTLAVILKSEFSRFFALFIFTFIPYIIVFSISKLLGMLVFLTLPQAVYLLFVMRDKKRHKILFRALPKKSWKQIIRSNCEYFYTRWLLARNLMAEFAVIASLYYLTRTL